ncbi:Ig-like domain-containing protein [Salinimicrobium sp. CAU 1759]
MVKKLLLKVFAFWALILTPSLGWGQCTDGPTTSATASISLQGLTNICSDESISFTSNIDLKDGVNPVYQWQVRVGSGSWTDLTGATSPNLTNYTPVQNNSRFKLQIIFCDGTAEQEVFESNISSSITVNQISTAKASISANKTEICPNESINFSASLENQGGSPTYSWRVNNVERGTSSTFSWNQFNNGDSVELWMTPSKACANDGDADENNIVESNIISITVKDAIPDQPSTIDGPANLCSNTSATYSISAVDRATSYQWTLPTGWTGNSTSTSINIISGNVANGQVVRVKAINDCGESTESTLTVDIGPGIPSNPGTISGPGLICPGDTVTFSVSNDPDVNSYTWGLPSNWSIQGGDDGASITAIAGGTNDDGTVTVFSTNNCEDSNISSLSVNINDPIPADPGIISGPTMVCPDTDVSYSIAPVNYADEYIWYVDNAELTGQNGTTIAINSGTTGTRNIKVIAVNECVDPTDYTSIAGSILSITVDDGTPGDNSITQSSPDGSSGNSTFCPGETGLMFSVSQDGRIDTYSWTVPSGWTITSGAGTNEITVTSGQLGNDGNIQFTGTSNDCGSVSTSYAVSVKNPAPVINTEAISGEAKVCRNATGLTYTLPSIQYADNYVWSVPGNWNITSGQDTNTIIVSAGSDDGNVTVYAENDCGQTSIVNFAVESIDAAPAAPGAIESTDAFEADPKICPPLNPLFLSVPFVSDDISYNWILPTGWEIIGDETSNEISVNITAGGDYNDTETVQVTATNGCFTSAATTSFAMTISDYIITDLGDDQTVCSTTNQITIPGEIRFGNSKKFNPIYTAINGNGTDVTTRLSGLPTSFNNYPNTFTFNYNPTATDRASGFVTISVQVPPPATSGNNPEACGTGYAEMTIIFRPEPTASISATTEICEGQTAEVSFTATPNTTLTYSINSGTNQTIQIGDTGQATLTTAALSGDTSYSLTGIQYTQAPNCSTTISESANITVNPIPSVDISYADYCSSETTPATVSYSNEVGSWQTGTFSASGALGSEIQADGSFIPADVAPGTYIVTYEITGSGGCENVSVTTEVTVYEEVSITQDPSNQRICEGGNAEFEVTATGEGLSYQWYKGAASAGNEISGATGNILNLSNIDITDAGDYLVVVSGTDPCSSKTSLPGTLTIDENINIDSQPADLTICEGENTSLTVSASVGGVSVDNYNTYSYQWYKGSPGSGTEIPGMNAATLPLNSVSPDDSGSYYVEISGPSEYKCSLAVSAAAVVNVKPTPTVAISGDNSICNGESTEINFFNGIPGTLVTFRINGDNNNQANIILDNNGEATLDTGSLQATNDTDTPFVYEIVSVSYADTPDCIQNFTSPLPSATVMVAANPDVTISFPGDQTEFCTADNTEYVPSLKGTGEFSGGTWSANGISINSSTGAFIPGAENSGDYTITYTVPAYGGCAEETTTLDISIYEEVQITSEPTNIGICSTMDAEFYVGASGDELTYQWYKDGNVIEGATSPTLSLPVATSADAGDYFAMVSGTNACTPDQESQVQSETVTLNVDEDIVILKPADDVRVCEDSSASVEFKFIAHAEGAPLTFEWIYADGTPVDISDSDISTTLLEKDTTAFSFKVYEGTLKISNITSADQASYAVRIDGSANNFNCPKATSNSFNLDVDPLPDAPTSTSPVEYCLGENAEVLTASGDSGATFTWYDSNGNEIKDSEGNPKAPTPDTSTPGTTTYYVTQKDTYCESPQSEVVVTVFDKPAAPVLTESEKNITYCLGDTADPLSINLNGATSANWYDSASSTTPLEETPTPQTTAQGDINYWISFIDENGCESEKAMVTVHTSALPEIILPEDQEICEGNSFEVTASDSNEITGSPTTYTWNWEGNTGDPLTGAQQTLSPIETTTYTVTATNANGCTNTNEIIINVDPAPAGGNLEGPSSVCVTNPSGVLDLSEYSGTIAQWERKTESQSVWSAIAEDTPDANFQFNGLTETTSFRVLVGNGVCEEVYSNELTVTVDPEPVAGQILFKGTDRVFMMCEFPTDDYLVPLQTSGTFIGDIVAWQYRRNSQTDWTTIMDGTEPFTGFSLSGTQVNQYSANESTLFRVEVQSGACTPNVYSDYATLSIIPSDIAPSPVEMTPGEVCLGEIVTMSSQTGYGGSGTFEGGAFDNSSIANHGWRVMRYGNSNNGTEYTFESAADNTRPDRWMRTNPHDYLMANPNGNGNNIYQRFDSCSCDEGNKGFAIVSGNNPSTLETPVFNTYTMDNPTLTFDQAYNLTYGDTIRVELSLDGGNTYGIILMEIGGPANPGDAPVVSGNYAKFGDDGLGEPNNMEIDLSNYAGLDNLRIRWLYDGSTGGIYTIDDIGIPQDPQNVQLIWYYDEDINDDSNPLEQIGEVNQQTVTYPQDGAEWPKIGWNDFEVQTALVFDTNGDPCESAENSAVASVYVFDNYTSTATAQVGNCGNTDVQLSATINGVFQGEITEFPEGEGSTVAWEIIEAPTGYEFSESHFINSDSELAAINDPNAIFQPPLKGNYTIRFTITPNISQTTRNILGEMVTQDVGANPCPMTHIDTSFEFLDCTTLDFDGVDDYVDLGSAYNGNFFIEAWIRPFDRPIDGGGTTNASTGVIFSSSGFEIKMENLPAEVVKNGRWYHIAVANNGDLWIDGISSGKIDVTGSGINNTSIGARYNANTKATSNHFSGWIEEVRIWNNPPTLKELRFMMNQRLKLNAAGTVVSPLEGEVVPNRTTAGSYHTSNSNNLDWDDEPFYDQEASDLAGYYRLISAEPDPILYIIPDTYKPTGGETPDLSGNGVPGRLHNMTTHQQNTSPTPYFSGADGVWHDENTWARPDVWTYPHEGDIEWNIARSLHQITSDKKEIFLLGLLSEAGVLDMEGSVAGVTGNELFISHYLLLDAVIDLNGESQLVQPHGSIAAGSGYLERDQQGTASSFNYNYWSSPVTTEFGSTNYEVGSTMFDGSITGTGKFRPITFVTGPFGADTPYVAPPSNPAISITDYWIHAFFPENAGIYVNWSWIKEDTSIKIGEGFTMKGAWDVNVSENKVQNYTFKGFPNNGNINMRTVSPDQNYLIGNPYPSAIEAKKFIDDNNGKINGALYFWDHFAEKSHYLQDYVGGYATRSRSIGVPAAASDHRINATGQIHTEEVPGPYVPVGQGFFINSSPTSENGGTSGIPVFNNTQRHFYTEANKGDTTAIFHSAERKEIETRTQQSSSTGIPIIRLNYTSPKGFWRQIAVGAIENTTENFDYGEDAPLLDDFKEDMYWLINDRKYVIQGVPDFHEQRVLKLGVKIDEVGEFSIQLAAAKNVQDEKEIYILDRNDSLYHDLRAQKFTKTLKRGIYNDRFELVFSKPGTVIEPQEPEEPIVQDGPLEVIYVNGSREVLIKNPELLDISRVYLNNMLGQQVHVYYNIPRDREVNLPVQRFGAGVYIVKMHTEKGIIVKKVILE